MNKCIAVSVLVGVSLHYGYTVLFQQTNQDYIQSLGLPTVATKVADHALSQKPKKTFSNNADITMIDKLEKTSNSKPFPEAARLLNIDALEKLVKEGFDINTKNEHGDTALSIALSSGDLYKVKALIEMGANIWAETYFHDKYGGALALALQQKSSLHKSNIIEYLIEEYGLSFSENPDKIIKSIIGHENKQYVMEILPHIKIEKLKESLHHLLDFWAADDDVVDYFLDKGVVLSIKELTKMSGNQHITIDKIKYVIDKFNLDIDEIDPDEFTTPLMEAVMYADIEKVEFYLKEGADPEKENQTGFNSFRILGEVTPTTTAIKNITKDDMDKIKLLLNKYAGRQ